MKCDCCRVLIGDSKYTIITEHDVQLYICEDCLTPHEGEKLEEDY